MRFRRKRRASAKPYRKRRYSTRRSVDKRRQYRARILGEKFTWTKDMEAHLRELQPQCVICGTEKDLTTDHVRPLKMGYVKCPGNVVRLCRTCNSKKGAKGLTELPAIIVIKLLENALEFEASWKKLQEDF